MSCTAPMQGREGLKKRIDRPILHSYNHWRMKGRPMETLKEYAGVITAAVTMLAALGALGLWAINAQVMPEIGRVDGRIDSYESLYKGIDARLDPMDARLDRIDVRLAHIDERFDRIDERLARMDQRFDHMNERFDRMDDRISQRLDALANNVSAILSRLPVPANQQDG